MRYVALLRGINVGGTKGVAMTHLRSLFEDLGHESVRTYINSGNVIFDAPRTRATRRLAPRGRSREAFGVTTRILVLPGSTVSKIAASLPEDWSSDKYSCNVLYLLPERASPRALEAFDLNPEYEEARYVAGAILMRVVRAYVAGVRCTR